MSELEPTRTYSNPTATDVLRRLLDERGVEYMKVDFLDGEHITSFDVNGREYGYHEFPDGGTLLRVWHPTPEQAIAATLGSCNCSNNCTNSERTETCHDTGTYCFSCSECGWTANEPHYLFGGFQPNYCPNCGRKVVDG